MVCVGVTDRAFPASKRQDKAKVYELRMIKRIRIQRSVDESVKLRVLVEKWESHPHTHGHRMPY